jgi:Cys-tRNA(Pro)/Cys-tRNA(Cys) deacylase
MTPAINTAKKAKINFSIHEYNHDPQSNSYGEEAAEKLGLEQGRVFKTLVVSNENDRLCVAIVPVSSLLNFKLLAKAIGSKKAGMADKKRVEKITGYVLGGVSPLGQKKKLPTIVHETAQQYETVFVSAGKRGLQIELSPGDLVELTSGKYGKICQ